METPSDISVLLSRFAAGDEEAGKQLMPLVYDELKLLAKRYMRRERPNHMLQTTALVHEAYLKLMKQQEIDWHGRPHFLGIAAHLMRRILIDHARGHLRSKRAGDQQLLPLDDAIVYSPQRSEELLRLDEALDRLSKLDARQGRIVELRFYGGLSVEETAEFLKISPKTVKRDWSVARAWLHAELRNDDGDVRRAVGPR